MLFNTFQIILLQDILNDLEIHKYFIYGNEGVSNEGVSNEEGSNELIGKKEIKQEILNNFIKYYKSIPIDLQTDRYFDSILYHYKNIYLELRFS